MKKILGALALVLTTVSAFAATTLSLDGSDWEILFSDNCPGHPTTVSLNGETSWRLRLRNDCKPDYVLHDAGSGVRAEISDSGSSILVTMGFANISGLKSVQDGGSNVYATVMLQRKDDNLSGDGKYEFYRLWAGGVYRIKIVNGTYTVTIPIDTSKWTGVLGRNPSSNQMNDTLNNLWRLGVTFGGTSDFGHGIKGAADIYMSKFRVN